MNSHSISDCIKRFPELNAVSDSARLDTEVILAWVLCKDRTYLFTWPEKTLTTEQYQAFFEAFEKRKQGIPIAYITGEREFWSLPFYTDSSTLIPRPDTEILVDYIINHVIQPGGLDSSISILDLGTGTGAIAISLAKELPNSQVDAVDVNNNAVALAKRNAERNGISNINIFQSDWFENIQDNYDIIVSNPPYIDASDPHLKEGDVRFEPSSALISEKDGLADIETICKTAPQFLRPSGILLVEHGWKQGLEVREIFKRNFNEVQTIKDYSNNERVTTGIWKR